MNNQKQRVGSDELNRMLERYLPDSHQETIRVASAKFAQIICADANLRRWANVLEVIDLIPLTKEHMHDVMLSVEMFLDMMTDKYHLCQTIDHFTLIIKGLTGFPLCLASKCAALDLMVITAGGATMSSAIPCHFKLYDTLKEFYLDPDSFSDPSFYVKSITAHVIRALTFYADGISTDKHVNDPAIRKAMKYIMGWKDLM